MDKNPPYSLSYTTETEDIRFLVSYYTTATYTKTNGELELTSSISKYNTVDEILQHLYEKFEPTFTEKTLKRAKRLRSNPEITEVSINICSLIVFFHFYRMLLNTGNTKKKAWLDKMAALIKQKIPIDVDFQLLEIRVGKIIKIEEAPGMDKLYMEDVLVNNTIRVFSGLREYVKKEELLNKQFLFVTNTKPVKFSGMASEGMILCAQGDCTEVIPVPEGVNHGTRLQLEGYEPICKDCINVRIDLKKPAYANAFKCFRIENGFLTFKGIKVMCANKYIVTKTLNGSIS